MKLYMEIELDDEAHAALTAMCGSPEEVEELLVHEMVADHDYVKSAAMCKVVNNGVSTPMIEVRENTRQER